MAVEGIADAPVRLKADRVRGRRALEHGCHELDNLDACRNLYSYDYDYVADAKFQACDGWLPVVRSRHLPSCAHRDASCTSPGTPRTSSAPWRCFDPAVKNETSQLPGARFCSKRGKFFNADPAGAFGP